MSKFRLNLSKLKKLNKKGSVTAIADMSKYCTYRCGGKARVLLEINTLENFIQVIKYLSEMRIPYFILGNGSNILVSDKGYNGVVLKFAGDLARIEKESDTLLECGAGVRLSRLFAYSCELGLGGLEDGAGIPATIGGAVYMNASAYNYQTADIVKYVVAYVDGKLQYFDKDSCKFGYRTSIFQNNSAIILRVGFELIKSDKKSIMDKFILTAKKRSSSQPLDKPSAGSVFKRIDGIVVSRLLDEAGLKGLTIGDAQVSMKHANFIVNLGGAKAQNIYDLIQVIKKKIKDKYDVMLETEIKFLGEFK